jgi:tRNA-modifying protein YgfZ
MQDIAEVPERKKLPTESGAKLSEGGRGLQDIAEGGRGRQSIGAWFDRDVVRASGADAATFLHGQLSQDVEGLAPGTGAWTLLLQPAGKLVAWLRITRVGDDEFLLDVAPGWAPAVVERLSRFKIRTACDLEELSGWRMVAVRGAAAPDDLEAGPNAFVVPAAGAGAGVVGFDLLGTDIVEPDGLIIDADAVESDRVTHGVPEMGAELDDTVIPAEMGAWFVEDSVSWTKGCYTGQELVARVDSRGSNTPRHLRTLELTGPASAGAEVTDAAGTAVGHVSSVFGSTALGVLRRSVEPPAAVSVAGHPARVTR